MAVTYLSRHDLGLPPVGDHHDAAGTTTAYPWPKDREAFQGLVAHHTVSVLDDWDRDGHRYGDLDDIRAFMARLAEARVSELGPEVPYTAVVVRDETDPLHAFLCEGRGAGRVGAHTAGLNSSRYGVAFEGNTSTRRLTPGEVDAFRLVGRWLTVPAPVHTTGHRDHKATECPGDGAYGVLDLLQPPFTGGLELSAQAEKDIADLRAALPEIIDKLRHLQTADAQGYVLHGTGQKMPLHWFIANGLNRTLALLADQDPDTVTVDIPDDWWQEGAAQLIGELRAAIREELADVDGVDEVAVAKAVTDRIGGLFVAGG